jgi:HPt (histidine-containing phosphotransfer) domain-containing protein
MHKLVAVNSQMPSGRHAQTSVQSRGSTWFQSDLGEELDVEQLSQLSDLDPTGAKGVVNDVLVMLMESLDPTLVRLERHKASGDAVGLRFEAHKLQSASGQLGALRLSEACRAVSAHVAARADAASSRSDLVLDALVDAMSYETVRLERRLRRLLNA